MAPEMKKHAVEIVKKYDLNAWGIECCHELMLTFKVKLSDIPTL